MLPLIYEWKVPVAYRATFVARIRVVAAELRINPNWVMAIINWESAGTFKASITNSIGATGLIQFMPSTAIELGTTTAYLRSLTAVQQLDWVLKYYKMWYKRLGITTLNNYVDCYLITFFPKAVNRGMDFLIQTASLPAQLIATQNPGFDKYPKDNKIYVHEINRVMLAQLPTEWAKNFVEKKKAA